MDIIVCMKQVPDLQQIRIKDRKPILENVPYVWGDIDKNAIEEAVRIKQKLGEGKITVVAKGSDKLQQGILEPLAMGADEAVPFSSREIAAGYAAKAGGRVVRLSDIPDAYIAAPYSPAQSAP
ncbi:MAG TPA: hypothetical protein ENO24_09100, partial [Chloroflexi bacterium]|nr:hypothetical protein [Chloroflexota bacterium]